MNFHGSLSLLNSDGGSLLVGGLMAGILGRIFYRGGFEKWASRLGEERLAIPYLLATFFVGCSFIFYCRVEETDCFWLSYATIWKRG